MAEIAHSIDLNLPEKLKEQAYRQKFFLAESSAQIAAQLIALRKKRDLNQQEVAELIGTQQPAISRIEKADYQSWSFTVLRKIADALDARLRVIIEPAEDIIREYDEGRELKAAADHEIDVLREILRPSDLRIERRRRDVTSLLGNDEMSAAKYHAEIGNLPGEVPQFDSTYSVELQRRAPATAARV
jgi:transcriptional regulator with XRE-family HTH domain